MNCCTSAWTLTHNTIGPFSNSVELLELFHTPAGPKLQKIRGKNRERREKEERLTKGAKDCLGGVLDLHSVNGVNRVNADPTSM